MSDRGADVPSKPGAHGEPGSPAAAHGDHEHMFVSEVAKPTLRVSGLLIQERRVLMVQQARREETYWLVPGGGVEFGESLSEALRREVLEELGLRVAVGGLVAIIESISPDPAYAKHVVHMLFAVSAAREVPPTPRDAAILEAAFLDEVQLRNADVRPPINEFLCDCLRELPKSPQFLGRRW
jgi:ADP-ribose pyrophosphatase YjhB (NUDIX family)